MRAHTPSPNKRAVGHDDGGAGVGFGPGLTRQMPPDTAQCRRAGAAAQFAHDQLQEEQRGFGGLLVFREIALDALFLFAAEGRVGEDHVHAVALADVGELEAEGVAAGQSAGRPDRAAAGSSGRADTAATWVRSRTGICPATPGGRPRF